MKLGCIDEFGSNSDGDVFVTAGLLIDAHPLRKYKHFASTF
mgnify:CR=1 FL=1